MTQEEQNPTLSQDTAKDARFAAGVVVTVLWLIVVAALVWWKRDKVNAMELNAIGDFMAGAFAPLAFFWLVLGYLQQGDELRNSQKALLLQADELRNSVEQQRELVEVSRQQMEGERQALEEERALRSAAAKPYFVIRLGGFSRGENRREDLCFTNSGGDVTDVSFSLEVDGEAEPIRTLASFKCGTEVTIQIPIPERFNALSPRLYVHYVDGLQRRGVQTYQLSMGERLSAALLTPARGAVGL